MIIKPKVRGFMCVTTHPTGCDQNIKNQIDLLNHMLKLLLPPKSFSYWFVNWLCIKNINGFWC